MVFHSQERGHKPQVRAVDVGFLGSGESGLKKEDNTNACKNTQTVDSTGETA